MSDATPGDAKERSAEQNKSEAELIGRIIQSEQKLSDYFTTMIVKSVSVCSPGQAIPTTTIGKARRRSG